MCDLQAEVARKVGELDMRGVCQVAWCHSVVRDKDAQHRAPHDANVLHALASHATTLIQARALASAAAAGNTTSTSVSGAAGNNSSTHHGGEGGFTSALLTTLLSYANLSHHDKKLLAMSAAYLAPRLPECTAQVRFVIP
jgi:hypothetical protein